MPQTELIPAHFRDGACRMAAALRDVDRILVSGHVNPDGDAVGSLAAAGHILRSLGKEFILYSSTGLPQYLWNICPSRRAAPCCWTAANPSAWAGNWPNACPVSPV